MPRRATQNRSGRTTDPSTDKAHNTVNEAFNSTEEWLGGQVERTPWFTERLESVDTDFKFRLLCEHAVVATSRGTIAVFSAEHAKEHIAAKNKGTIRSPNMRTREAVNTTAPQQPLAVSPAHGGYPGAPTPTVNPTAAPAQTYAAATATSSSGRPITQLELELGASANEYTKSITCT